MVRRLRRLLRSPRTIVAELAVVALAAVTSTLVPQRPGVAARVRFAEEHPWASPWVQLLGLDHVFTTGWFLAVIGLATVSLGIVLWEQWRRAIREWHAPLAEAAFRGASFRREFERPISGAARSIVATSGRLGLLGSPLFHLGLLIAILSGAGRALLSAEAQVDLYEGETLAPTPGAFGASWPGPLAKPIAFRAPIEFVALEPERHAAGALSRLSARIRVQMDGAVRDERVAVNAPFDLGAERLYLSSVHGVAAFVEMVDLAGRPDRRVLLLEESQPLQFGSTATYPGELLLRLLAEGAGDGSCPAAVEVRVIRRGGLASVGRLTPGTMLQLPTGERIHLAGLRWWARFSAARDLSAWPAYLGFAMAIIGACLMFLVVKVDTLMAVSLGGEGRERVTVALRAQRFAPLFAERFERLVREHGGDLPG